MSAINLVGLEVEGGWNGKPMVPPFEDIDLAADLSIDGTTMTTDNRLLLPHVGEAISPPLPVEAVDDWIERHWPHGTNITCGYHIHVSLKNNLHYMLLTRKSFMLQVMRNMRSLALDLGLPPNHYIWHRLSGTNPFCTYQFDAGAQMEIKKKRVSDRTRYGFLNFAKGVHGTMEFRALPTFENAILAKRFTHLYLNLIEEYCEKERDSIRPRELSIADRGGDATNCIV